MSDKESLKDRALRVLREWAEDGLSDEVYSLEKLAKHLECTVQDLFDWSTDSGVIYDLYMDGDVGLTADQKCVFPMGRRVEWGW